jgi:hypothetical protein
VDYIIDGAYRAKMQFSASAALNGPAHILQFNQQYIPQVAVGTKAILQKKIPESGTPINLVIYTLSADYNNWLLQLFISRHNFDKYFEKLTLSVTPQPALMMKIKLANQTTVAHPLLR